MAQYYTDFSEYADTAALLSDWTSRWHSATVTLESDAGATGGKFFRVATANQRHMHTWNDLDSDPDRDELEILARIRQGSLLLGTLGVAGRVSGDSSSETAYTCGFSGSSFRLTIYDNAGFALLSTGGTSTSDDWYWVRAQIRGTALKLNAWTGAVGDDPGGWEIEVTNSTISAAGLVGIFSFASGNHDVDVFAVGTGTDSAPTGPVGGTIPTLSAPGVTEIGSTSVRPQITLTF